MRRTTAVLWLVLGACDGRDAPASEATSDAPPPQPRAAAAPASSPLIHVNLRNDCDATRRLARDTRGHGPVGEDATVFTLAAGEQRTIEVPAHTWLRALADDGTSGFAASLDASEDGGWIVFDCEGVRASAHPLAPAPRRRAAPP